MAQHFKPFCMTKAFLNHLHRRLWLQNLVLLCWLNIPAWNIQQLALWQNILLVNIKSKGSLSSPGRIVKCGCFQRCSLPCAECSEHQKLLVWHYSYQNECLWLSILLKCSDLHRVVAYKAQKSLNSINPENIYNMWQGLACLKTPHNSVPHNPSQN